MRAFHKTSSNGNGLSPFVYQYFKGVRISIEVVLDLNGHQSGIICGTHIN